MMGTLSKCLPSPSLSFEAAPVKAGMGMTGQKVPWSLPEGARALQVGDMPGPTHCTHSCSSALGEITTPVPTSTWQCRREASQG